MKPLLIALLISGASMAATVKVEITKELKFTPHLIEVNAGDTVEFTNASKWDHTVTADPTLVQFEENVILPQGATPFHSGPLKPGATFSQTFTVPGLYQYTCLPHETMNMNGQVLVKAND